MLLLRPSCAPMYQGTLSESMHARPRQWTNFLFPLQVFYEAFDAVVFALQVRCCWTALYGNDLLQPHALNTLS